MHLRNNTRHSREAFIYLFKKKNEKIIKFQTLLIFPYQVDFFSKDINTRVPSRNKLTYTHAE